MGTEIWASSRKMPAGAGTPSGPRSCSLRPPGQSARVAQGWPPEKPSPLASRLTGCVGTRP